MSAAPVAASTRSRRTARQVPRLLSCIRFEEVFVLQGAPLLGAIFSMGSFTVESVGRIFVFAIGSCLLVAHVFVLNDWSGIHADLRDPNRAAAVFSTRDIDRAEIG